MTAGIYRTNIVGEDGAASAAEPGEVHLLHVHVEHVGGRVEPVEPLRLLTPEGDGVLDALLVEAALLLEAPHTGAGGDGLLGREKHGSPPGVGWVGGPQGKHHAPP